MPRAKPAESQKKTGDKMESLIERTDPEADERRDESSDDDDDETFERDPDDEGPEDSDTDDE